MKKLLMVTSALVMSASAAPVMAATVVSADFGGGSYGGLTNESKGGAIQIVRARPAYQDCCGVTGSDAALDNPFAVFGTGNVQNNGSLFAEFQTLLGQAYTVSFRYGALGSGSDFLNFGLGGFSQSLLAVANNNIDATYTTFTYNFVGTGSPTTVSFSGRGSGTNVDVILDDVNVAAVPEPATWAMMLMGFGLVGFGLRSRKSGHRTIVRFA